MLRTALRPRWLALLLVVLVAVGVMARLGQWQWDRARQHGLAAQRHLLERPVVPIGTVLIARQSFGSRASDRPVSAVGRWDAGRQLLIAGRTRATGSSTNPGSITGQPGWWVLTPLLLPDGSAVPVVRGWVSTPADPRAARDAVPAGQVSVTGILEPAEPAADRQPGQTSGLPSGQLDRVAVTQLVQLWPYPLLTGYVVQRSQVPPLAPAPDPVQVVPVNGGLALQNLSYAVQWFLFAGLAFGFWWRVVRDDWRRCLAAAAPGAGADPDPADPEPDRVPVMGDDGGPTTAARGVHP